jgi:hypothetical protein
LTAAAQAKLSDFAAQASSGGEVKAEVDAGENSAQRSLLRRKSLCPAIDPLLAAIYLDISFGSFILNQ